MERSSSSSSSSTDPPSIDLACSSKPFILPPQFRTELKSTSPKAHPSTIYTLAHRRSKVIFIEKDTPTNSEARKCSNYSCVSQTANPMAVRLARRQAYAAQLMAEGESLRPCRLDMRYKSPRRVKHVFRNNNDQWSSQYVADYYLPVEVAPELTQWSTDIPVLLRNVTPVQEADCCFSWWKRQDRFCCLYKKPTASRSSEREIKDERTCAYTDEEIATAMKRTCRIRKPWPVTVEQMRKREQELLEAGIWFLCSILTARAEALGLDTLYDVPDVSEQVWEATQAFWMERTANHLSSFTDIQWSNFASGLCRLNLTQLCYMRRQFMKAPKQTGGAAEQPRCSAELLKKRPVKALVEDLTDLIAERTWSFVAGRAVRKEETEGVLQGVSHVLPAPSNLHSKVRDRLEKYWLARRHSETTLLATHRRCSSSSDDTNTAFVPEFQPRVARRLGRRILASLGALELASTEFQQELLESPVQIFATQQSWWLIDMGELKAGDMKMNLHRRKPLKPLVSEATSEPRLGCKTSASTASMPTDSPTREDEPKARPFNLRHCFVRVPGLELMLERPRQVPEVYTLSVVTPATTPTGFGVWAIRAVAQDVDLNVLKPPPTTEQHINAMLLDKRFQARREAADAATITKEQIPQKPSKSKYQRLRSVSGTRAHALNRSRSSVISQKLTSRRTSNLLQLGPISEY